MANRYWVGNGGNWSDNTNHWSASSGGAPGASLPTSSDNVFFDANSFSSSGQTVTINSGATRNCKDMDWTGATNSPTLTQSVDLNFNGTTFKLISAMSYTATSGTLSLYPPALGTLAFTTAGKTIPVSIYAGLYGGSTISLQDDLTISGEYQQTDSATSFSSNNHNITCTNFLIDGDVGTTLGTSTITASGNVDFDLFGTGVNELSAASVTVVMTGASKYFYINSLQTIGTLTAQNTSTITATGGTIGTLNLTAGKTYTIDVSGANDTINISTAFNATGSSGNLITITSATQHTFSKTSGTVNASYLNLVQSNATGGATWNAVNSTDGGGNSGWVFSTTKTSNGLLMRGIG